MRLGPQTRTERQNFVVFVTACPLLILTIAQFFMFHLDLAAAVALMQTPLLLTLEALLAACLLVVSLVLLFFNPKLGLSGIALLGLAILLLVMGPATTICY